MRIPKAASSGLILGLCVGWLGLAGDATAQFLVQEHDAAAFQEDRGRSATVRFEPRLTYIVEQIELAEPAEHPLPMSVEGLDPVEDWDLIAMANGMPQEEVPSTSGALVALPGTALDWSFEVTPASAAGAVTVSEAIVGTIPCLHVVVDRALAGEAGDEIEIRLIVDAAPDADLPRRSLQSGGQSARVARTLFLNGDALVDVPLATSTVGRSRDAQVLPPPPGDVRITYKKGEGLVAIPLADLGIEEAEVDDLRIVYHGATVSVLGVFGSDVLLYAPRNNTLFDKSDSVFASADEFDPSPTAAVRDAFSTLAPSAGEVEVARTRLHRPIGRYERASIMPSGDRFVPYRIQRPNTVVTPLPVNDYLTSPDVFMQIRILGLDTNSSQNPDHFADVSLQGVAIPRIEWKGRTQVQRAQTITLPSLPNPANLSLTHTVPSVVSISDLQNLRDVTLAWTGYPRIDPDGRTSVQIGVGAEPRLLTIGGFPVGTTADDLLVLDVTIPTEPIRIADPFLFTDASGTIAMQIEVPATSGVYFAQRVDAAEQPLEVVEAEVLPATTGPEVTLGAVYVRDPVLAEELGRLIEVIEDGVIELDPQAAYNAYSGGQQDPEAIRSALRDLLEAAPQREVLPRLVLVGDGTFDLRDYLGFQMDTPQVPVYVEDSLPVNGIAIESSIDYYYAALFGDDDLEDAQISRLPVKSSAELSIIIDRILAHRAIEEELGNHPGRVGLFIGAMPRPSEFIDFRVDSAALAVKYEDTGKSSYFLELANTREPQLTEFKTVLATNEGGVALVMYTGHGNIERWGDENFLLGNDIPTLETEDNWPLVTTFTCLNSYYAFPGASVVAMAKRWLTTPDRGAIATISPTALETYAPQLEFSKRFVNQLRQPVGYRPKTVGEAFALSRIEYLTQLPGLGRTGRSYLMFGEPTSSLTIPASVDHDFMRIY